VQYSLLDNLIVNLEEKNCEAICHYVKRLPRALAAVFCRWAFEKDARLTTVIGPTGLPTYAGASLGFAMEDQGRCGGPRGRAPPPRERRSLRAPPPPSRPP
jgi:hypothetical protein